MLMGLLQLIAVLVIVGVILWAMSQFAIDPVIAKIIRVIIVVAITIYVVFWLLGLAGIAPLHFNR